MNADTHFRVWTERLLGNRHAENGWSMLTHHCRFNRFQFLHRNWLAKISSSSVCLSILSCQYRNWFPRQKKRNLRLRKKLQVSNSFRKKLSFAEIQCTQQRWPRPLLMKQMKDSDVAVEPEEISQSFLSGIHKNPHAECCRVLPCRGKEICPKPLHIYEDTYLWINLHYWYMYNMHNYICSRRFRQIWMYITKTYALNASSGE